MEAGQYCTFVIYGDGTVKACGKVQHTVRVDIHVYIVHVHVHVYTHVHVPARVHCMHVTFIDTSNV